jgi:hypothetical protein
LGFTYFGEPVIVKALEYMTHYTERIGEIVAGTADMPANDVIVSRLSAVVSDFGLSLPVFIVFVLTVGMLFDAFAFGGMARAAMNIAQEKPLPPPTQAIYGEFRYAFKWYAVMLIRWIVLLLLFALPYALLAVITVFIPAVGIPLMVLASPLIMILLFAAIPATYLMFPAAADTAYGMRRVVSRTWALIRKHPGLVIGVAVWIILFVMLSSIPFTGVPYAVTIILQLCLSAILAPMPAITVSLLYREIRIPTTEENQ